jgi:hypothetical protein
MTEGEDPKYFLNAGGGPIYAQATEVFIFISMDRDDENSNSRIVKFISMIGCNILAIHVHRTKNLNAMTLTGAKNGSGVDDCDTTSTVVSFCGAVTSDLVDFLITDR